MKTFETVPAMLVEEVHTDHGSHIEPPMNQDWDDLTALSWQAGVVAAATGLNIKIYDPKYKMNGRRRRGFYGLMVGGSSTGPHDFHSAWTYLAGVRMGFQAARADDNPGPGKHG